MLKSWLTMIVYALMFMAFGFFFYNILGHSKEYTIATLVCIVGASIMSRLYDIESKIK